MKANSIWMLTLGLACLGAGFVLPGCDKEPAKSSEVKAADQAAAQKSAADKAAADKAAADKAAANKAIADKAAADKAAADKAMAEKVVVAKSRMMNGGTTLCVTRYGNVMASRGSVIPLFVSQIKAGLPLTVTDPKMTRFLMSLEDSVDLVIHAYENGSQGDIFVQKAPASTLEDLALVLKDIFNASNPVKIIGTRHGEKLYETLVAREEMAKAQNFGRYYRVPADNRDLNYNKYFVEGKSNISELDDYTSHNTERLDKSGVKKLLMSLDYIRDELATQRPLYQIRELRR